MFQYSATEVQQARIIIPVSIEVPTPIGSACPSPLVKGSVWLGPAAAVEGAILDGFAKVLGLNVGGGFEVGNGAGHFQDAALYISCLLSTMKINTRSARRQNRSASTDWRFSHLHSDISLHPRTAHV